MSFRAGKAAAFVLIAASILIWWIPKLKIPLIYDDSGAKSPPVHLTLIPDYESNTLGFEGSAPLNPASDSDSEILDVRGLPVDVGPKWPDGATHTWYFMGTIKGGEIVTHESGYQVRVGPVTLQPSRGLELYFPFVVLDPSEIKLRPEPPDRDGPQKLPPLLSYEAGSVERTIDEIYIPFQHIQKDIHLTLTPLVGEALAGNSNGLRLSGKVEFSSLTLFQTFRDYCPDAASTFGRPDYRREHLLNVLDFSPFSRGLGFTYDYQYQLTALALRTELLSCQYDTANRVASVEAAFFGKIFGFNQSSENVPDLFKQFLYSDGNYSYDSDPTHPGPEAYQIRLGKIVLGPGDTLTINVPHTRVLVERISPAPHDLIFTAVGQAQQAISIVYHGPLSFELQLPYVTEPGLSLSQFPAVLRPGLLWIARQFENLFPFRWASSTWAVLGMGLLFVVVSRWKVSVKWLAAIGWLLIAVSFYYGVRGSFGLLCTALVFYVSQVSYSDWAPEHRPVLLRRLAAGLAGFVLVALGIYLDRQGAPLFRNLSQHDLSPLTPLILMILAGALLFPLYGWMDSKSYTLPDLPILMLFLAVVSLYDAFDKSLLALLIVFAAGLYIVRKTAQGKGDKALRKERQFGTGLQKRWNLVFRNKTVLTAIVVLLFFAVANDLPRIFAIPIQVSLPPLLAPLLISLLVIVSVLLTFASIVSLFVLVYPYLPFKRGYWKAAVFALVLFLVFLFGIGTDDRLIEFLPNLLIGRVIYYLSMPVLIGITFDIYEFMDGENQRLASQGAEKQKIAFREAASLYLKNLQGAFGTLAGIVSLAAPAVYGFFSNQPVIVTYFSLLQKLMLI